MFHDDKKIRTLNKMHDEFGAAHYDEQRKRHHLTPLEELELDIRGEQEHAAYKAAVEAASVPETTAPSVEEQIAQESRYDLPPNAYQNDRAAAKIAKRQRELDERLFDAIAEGSVTTVSMLILQGANVNARNDAYSTPLHAAAAYDHPQIAIMLLEAGANVNAQNNLLRTPLHTAMHLDEPTIAKLLLVAGADITLRNSGNETAIDEARAFSLREGKMHSTELADHVSGILADDSKRPTVADFNREHESLGLRFSMRTREASLRKMQANETKTYPFSGLPGEVVRGVLPQGTAAQKPHEKGSAIS